MTEPSSVYAQRQAWANVRRYRFGEGVSRPCGVWKLGSKVTPVFVADLYELGWKVAVLLDEENERG